MERRNNCRWNMRERGLSASCTDGLAVGTVHTWANNCPVENASDAGLIDGRRRRRRRDRVARHVPRNHPANTGPFGNTTRAASRRNASEHCDDGTKVRARGFRRLAISLQVLSASPRPFVNPLSAARCRSILATAFARRVASKYSGNYK